MSLIPVQSSPGTRGDKKTKNVERENGFVATASCSVCFRVPIYHSLPLGFLVADKCKYADIMVSKWILELFWLAPRSAL